MSLKLDLAGAAAEASQQGLSGDLWKSGPNNNQAGAHEQVGTGNTLHQHTGSAVDRSIE